MPVCKILSMSKNNRICAAYQRCYITEPFLCIFLNILKTCITDPDMSPCMTGELPSVCFDSICYFFCFFTFFIIIKIRIGIQPCLLICRQILSCLISNIGTISQNTIVSCQCDRSPCSMVCTVRMFFQKLIQQRNTVVCTGYGSSVSLNILTGRFPVLVQYYF